MRRSGKSGIKNFREYRGLLPWLVCRVDQRYCNSTEKKASSDRIRCILLWARRPVRNIQEALMRATLLIFLGILASAQTKMPEPAKIKIDFEKHVQPILAQKCYACHGEEVQQSGLRLDKRQNALRGGDYGPVIMPGKSTESKLIRRVVNGDGGLQMPPTGALSDEEIGILRAWIDQGADFRIEVQEETTAKVVN